MAYVDIKAGITAFAKVIQWFVMSKRMLLIVSPFLTIVAVLVWLAIVSIDILAAGRAYVEGESLWSKNQKEAVFYLLRFAETGSESHFLSYRKAIMVPLGSALDEAGPHCGRAWIRLFQLEPGLAESQRYSICCVSRRTVLNRIL